MIKGQPIINIQFQKETDIGGRKNHSILIPQKSLSVCLFIVTSRINLKLA